MPFNNLDDRHWSEEEKTQFLGFINQALNVARNKMANLSPEERQRFGSINEKRKLFVNKDLEYQQTEPEKASPDVDWVEMRADYSDSTFKQQARNLINGLLEGMFAAEILHDYDLYQNALIDYNYSKYKMESGAIGYETKVNDLKQFFPNTGGSANDDGTVDDKSEEG